MQGAGLTAQPALVAASGSGSSLGATIPGDKLTWPIPTSKLLIPPEALPPSGTADFVPPLFRSFLPMRDPRDARKTREQLSLNTFEVVDVQKGSKVISSPTSSYYVIGKIGSIPLND